MIPRTHDPAPVWAPDESQPLPASFSAESFYPPQRDQGPRGGTCVSFATADYLKAFRIQQGYSDPGLLSPLYINYWAGNMERMKRPKQDWQDGVAVESAFQVAVDFGVAPESNWPYNTSNAHVRPFIPNEVAWYNRITGYASLSATQRNSEPDAYGPAYSHYDLRLLKRAIQQRAGFVFAFLITGEGLYTVNGALEPGPPPYDPRSGGHCVVAVAYDDATQLVKIHNSFGPGWFGSVHYKDLLNPLWAFSLTVATGINSRREIYTRIAHLLY